MQENVRPVMAPRSRPSLQHVFIPPKIREYFDFKSRRFVEVRCCGEKNCYQDSEEA